MVVSYPTNTSPCIGKARSMDSPKPRNNTGVPSDLQILRGAAGKDKSHAKQLHNAHVQCRFLSFSLSQFSHGLRRVKAPALELSPGKGWGNSTQFHPSFAGNSMPDAFGEPSSKFFKMFCPYLFNLAGEATRQATSRTTCIPTYVLQDRPLHAICVGQHKDKVIAQSLCSIWWSTVICISFHTSAPRGVYMTSHLQHDVMTLQGSIRVWQILRRQHTQTLSTSSDSLRRTSLSSSGSPTTRGTRRAPRSESSS